MFYPFRPYSYWLISCFALVSLTACQIPHSSISTQKASLQTGAEQDSLERMQPRSKTIKASSSLAMTNFVGRKQNQSPILKPSNPLPTKLTEPDSSDKLHHIGVENTVFSFADAALRAQSNSAKLRANLADVQAKRLQREAVAHIDFPWLSVSATAARYRIHGDISTAKVQQRIDALGSSISGILGTLPSIPGLPPLPDLSHAGDIVPDTIGLEREATHTDLSLSAIWPAYTGGRLQAIKQYMSSRADEAQGTLTSDKNALYTTLVERYFGTQLAVLAESVRTQALRTIAKHDHMAQRFLDEGLIARDKRLEASAKLAEAQDALAEASNRSKLAMAGLAQLLKSDEVIPATALFVNRHGIKPLAWYQGQALRHYPGFSTINAKQKQVEALRTISDAASKPSVTVVGRHEIKPNDADWLVGVNVHYTLFSGIDRKKMHAAAETQLKQVAAVREQAQSDIALLVEKHWLAVQDALTRFASYDQQLALASEQAQLASRSFSEGLATALDAIDADTNLARVRTERAQAAYDYVLALARLLESAGIADQFNDYLIDADTYINEASL